MNYFCFSPLLRFRLTEMITLLWWLFPPKISTNPFIQLNKQDISTSIYNLCNRGLKAKLLKAEFYKNIMIRFEKKGKSNHCRVMVKKKQHWNLKYQIQDPIMIHVYEHSFLSPPKIRGGFLLFKIRTRREVMKKLLRDRGVSWKREVLLERRGFQIVSLRKACSHYCWNAFFFVW